ncbi:MAG: hypothetical protein RL885_09940 [Planctomycetota bacterium]
MFRRPNRAAGLLAIESVLGRNVKQLDERRSRPCRRPGDAPIDSSVVWDESVDSPLFAWLELSDVDCPSAPKGVFEADLEVCGEWSEAQVVAPFFVARRARAQNAPVFPMNQVTGDIEVVPTHAREHFDVRDGIPLGIEHGSFDRGNLVQHQGHRLSDFRVEIELDLPAKEALLRDFEQISVGVEMDEPRRVC